MIAGSGHEFGVVVLAGGAGTRMGAHPKLLAPLAGNDGVRSLINRVLDPFGDVADMLIVTGHHRAAVESELGRVRPPRKRTISLGTTHTRAEAVDAALVELRAGVAVVVEGDTLVDPRAIGPFLARLEIDPPTAARPLRLLCCRRRGRPDRSTLVVDEDGNVEDVRRAEAGSTRLGILAAALHRPSLSGRIAPLSREPSGSSSVEWGLWQLAARGLLATGVAVMAETAPFGGVNVNTPADLEEAARLLTLLDAEGAPR